jgi:dTDP-4-amino-4,6-dideoxygalactose transaminase
VSGVSELAILGGRPAFPDGVPFVRPPVPSLERVAELLSPSWHRGILTNGDLVRELERRTADLLDVEHVVAVASCTTGLMLALRAIDVRGDVLLPSFTFSASAHAVAWNGCRPRFAECNAASFQVDVTDAAKRADGVGAVLATHVFGAPCDTVGLEALAANFDVPLVFDAAHGFGARRGDVPLGRHGHAEVFSMTPTKPLVAGEGGLVATRHADVAHAVRIGRDYANPGDYDTRFVGLNGRMSELHAATALASLESFELNQARRDELANRYRKRLAAIPGIRTQAIADPDTSTWKDFTIAIDAASFGVARDALRAALRADGIDTRCYFDPPVHRQTAYADLPAVALPVTDAVAASVLSLPIYPDLDPNAVDRIVELIATVHDRADEVRDRAAA